MPRCHAVGTNYFTIGVDNRTGGAPLAGGTVWLQVVSVFPPTYKNRPNGLRPDLANLIGDLHPKFLRFPGGNFVEGNYLAVPPLRAGRNTIGPVGQRAGHDNSAWGYWDDDGLGPGRVPALQRGPRRDPDDRRVRRSQPQRHAGGRPERDLAPYVQDALNEIEYVIGPVTSTWGAARGRRSPGAVPTPEIEIGNEDALNSGSASYNSYRYPMFYDAIKAAYPQIKLIATTPVTSRPMDILDEHFYHSASFFQTNAHHVRHSTARAAGVRG